MSYVNNIRMFVRVYELGSMSAAARDQRTSPAVASARISELEKHLGVRLFSRTTRSLQPTENGRIFYDGARRVLEAIDDAEAAVMDVTQNPRGTIFVAAPLGIGRRLIAPRVPAFKDLYPQIDVRLRLSDRGIDVVAEGIDVAFHLGVLEDSTLKVRTIADCPRLLCAAPPTSPAAGCPQTAPRW
jgi:DNA-binding transcriptional LysR family regulator